MADNAPTEGEGKPKELPKVVEERLKRGKEAMQSGKAKRTECLKFWRGEQYVYRTDDKLLSQSVVTNIDGSGKPRHRVRTTRNLILDAVAAEVSAATQRTPNYEVDPSTADPEDISASRLAGKVARYGYDKWNVRNITAKVVTLATVADEGFAWPHWDSTVGPYVGKDKSGRVLGQGEIKINVYSGNETFWEPGLKFERSRWHAIQQAYTPEAVMQMDGYLGGNLKTDAGPSGARDTSAKLVMVTEYLERPSPPRPNGRWLTIANGKQICAERPYPCADEKGRVVDEPVLHHLSYFTDPEQDRDMGLVRHLLDAQRTYNDCTNKQLEWKNLALNPQVVIQNGEFKERLTDEPGAVFHAVGHGEITWREVPQIPSELSAIKEEAKTDMAQISAQNEIPSQVASGQGIQALLDKDSSRRADFINNLAEFHSRLMRHCLYLVQRHYTEPRLLKIRGRYGPELIQDFMGSQLRGQADVTVLPGSITPRTRSEMETRVMNFAQLGWITPEQAMTAINAGSAENLVEGYEQDIARANLIIEKLREGPDVLFAMPQRRPFPGEDPGFQMDENGQIATGPDGMPLQNEYLPGWMPRPFDNISVQKTVFEDWFKTSEYDDLEPPTQEAANQYYAALLQLEQQKAMRDMQLQTQQAQDLGFANAAKPQMGSPNPSFPNGNGDQQSTQQPGVSPLAQTPAQ